jgi:hypothetical protein
LVKFEIGVIGQKRLVIDRGPKDATDGDAKGKDVNSLQKTGNGACLIGCACK